MRWTTMLLAVVVVLVAAPACTDASRLAMAGASLEGDIAVSLRYSTTAMVGRYAPLSLPSLKRRGLA